MRKRTLVFVIIAPIIIFGQFALAKGEWQISPHYGVWTLSPVKSLIEDLIGEALKSELQKLVEEYLPPDLDGDYSHIVDFDSSGRNLALELRFYPGGEDGSFSIGLAVEKSQLELTLQGSTRYELADGNYVDASGNARLLLEPISYHLGFRWDIMPSWRLHPYIGFGAGVGSLNGVITYDDVTAEVYYAPVRITIPYPDGQLDLTDLLEYLEYPSIPLIVLQLNLGFNLEITNNLYLLLDAGIWDGFLVRGGVCLRV